MTIHNELHSDMRGRGRWKKRAKRFPKLLLKSSPFSLSGANGKTARVKKRVFRFVFFPFFSSSAFERLKLLTRIFNSSLRRYRYSLKAPWQMLSVYRIVSQQGSRNLRTTLTNKNRAQPGLILTPLSKCFLYPSEWIYRRSFFFTFHLNLTQTHALSLRKMNFLSYKISSEQTISPLFRMTLHNPAPLTDSGVKRKEVWRERGVSSFHVIN